MSEVLLQPVELTDGEIDAVSGGGLVAVGNLVNVQANVQNVLNNNNVQVAAAVAALGTAIANNT